MASFLTLEEGLLPLSPLSLPVTGDAFSACAPLKRGGKLKCLPTTGQLVSAPNIVQVNSTGHV